MLKDALKYRKYLYQIHNKQVVEIKEMLDGNKMPFPLTSTKDVLKEAPLAQDENEDMF